MLKAFSFTLLRLNFSLFQVLHAQKRGAKLVIIMNDNNKKGEVPMNMGGNEAGINIPTCGISLKDGKTLKQVLFSFLMLVRYIF